ncbi:hypothetical protein AMATHDRAFT_55609 [Amanita thiersii Skay4041]|uniref:Nucleoporin Nup54 alpha-helical domain-containing protein n=1 Tax=Amanita thiersii Skay4041 TaxID=703135 RepID=A0A2A9NSR5_9AGAR|nr:hypothetical protein AMATHDRAFT_55609 [Amanita thiersii Skay4041]
MSFSSSSFGSSLFGAKPQGSSLFGTNQQQSSTPGQTQAPGNLFGSFGQNTQQQQQQQQPSTGGLLGQSTQQPAQGSSLFGSTTNTTQPSAGLFGGTSTTFQQPQTGGIFGTSTSTTQQPQTGGLFGNSTTTTQPQQTGGLFGSTTGSQQPSTGGLFGSTATGTQQPQTGSLFGSATGTQQSQSGGLFGSSTTTQPSTGLFGSTTTSAQQPQTGLFGSSSTSTLPQTGLFGNISSTQPQTTGGLFGSNQSQQQQQPSLWGSTTTSANPLQSQPTLPSFGNSIFPTKSQQPQQQQLNSGVFLTKSTKFNDLPEDVRKELEILDTFVQGQVQISKDLHQRKLGEEPLKGHELMKGVHRDFVNCSTTVRNDLHFMRDLKAKVDQAVEDTIVATRIVDGYRNPQAGGSGTGYLKEHATFPFEYFARITEQIKARLTWYKSTIEQIERKLTSSTQTTPHSIAATLQAQHQIFLALASKTATLDSEVQKLKALYTQLWRQKTGSMRDPFNELDRNAETDLGIGALNM